MRPAQQTDAAGRLAKPGRSIAVPQHGLILDQPVGLSPKIGASRKPRILVKDVGRNGLRFFNDRVFQNDKGRRHHGQGDENGQAP